MNTTDSKEKECNTDDKIITMSVMNVIEQAKEYGSQYLTGDIDKVYIKLVSEGFRVKVIHKPSENKIEKITYRDNKYYFEEYEKRLHVEHLCSRQKIG